MKVLLLQISPARSLLIAALLLLFLATSLQNHARADFIYSPSAHVGFGKAHSHFGFVLAYRSDHNHNHNAEILTPFGPESRAYIADRADSSSGQMIMGVVLDNSDVPIEGVTFDIISTQGFGSSVNVPSGSYFINPLPVSADNFSSVLISDAHNGSLPAPGSFTPPISPPVVVGALSLIFAGVFTPVSLILSGELLSLVNMATIFGVLFGTPVALYALVAAHKGKGRSPPE